MSDDALADYPKTVVLTDGAHLILRPLGAAERDLLAVLLGRIQPAEHVALHGDPVIVACDGERVAAAAALARGVPGVARLTVVIDPQYGGRRLGTWLLLDGVHLAAGLGVERLEARVRRGDAALLGALERLDFVADSARASPSELVLVKRLYRTWTDF